MTLSVVRTHFEFQFIFIDHLYFQMVIATAYMIVGATLAVSRLGVVQIA
jgi:hypothetical protein